MTPDEEENERGLLKRRMRKPQTACQHSNNLRAIQGEGETRKKHGILVRTKETLEEREPFWGSSGW